MTSCGISPALRIGLASISLSFVSECLETWASGMTLSRSGVFGEFQSIHNPHEAGELPQRMAALAESAGEMVRDFRAGKLLRNRDAISANLVHVLRALQGMADAANDSREEAALGNLQKVFSRYPIDTTYPPR